MRLPGTEENTFELPTSQRAMVERIVALLAQSPHGFLRARVHGSDHFLFFLKGMPHSAGRSSQDRFVASGIKETVDAMADVEAAWFVATDLPLLLCAAVPFRKAPSAQIPLKLVDPDTLMKSIRGTETDAVLVVRRADARTLVFCRNGEPEALYAAKGETFSSDGPIADRIVEYVFGDPDGPDVTLDIYDQIRLPKAPDAGKRLEAYADAPASQPEVDEPATIVVKLGDRVVFEHPIASGKIMVGRGIDADLQLDNLSVSRRHAEIVRDGGRLIVTDLGGRNGISFKGKKSERAELEVGMEVGIGKYTLEYAARDSVSAPPPQRQLGSRLAALEQTMHFDSDAEFPSIEFRGKSRKLSQFVATIGKGAGAHYKISGWFVADIHIQLIRQQDGETWLLRHAAGRRGVFVNGQRVNGERMVGVGDEIELARETFRIKAADG